MSSVFQTTKIPKKTETAIFFSFLFVKGVVHPCSRQWFVMLPEAEEAYMGERGYSVVMARAVMLIFMSGMDSSAW